MKKNIFIVILFITITNTVFAQNSNTFFKFSVGTGYLSDARIEDNPYFMFEFGKSFGWLDINASLDCAGVYAEYYQDNSHIKTNPGSTSAFGLGLKTKLDFIKMFFPETRHAFKIGAGINIVYDGAISKYTPFRSNFGDGTNPVYPEISFSTGYEYKFADKSWIGAFYTNSLSKYYIGLSIRRDF